MIKAVKNRNLEQVKFYFNFKKFKLDVQSCEPFMIALDNGLFDIVQYFIKNGIDIQSKSHLDTVISLISNGKWKIINLLLE